jgi:hypothetical protein
MRWNSEGIGLIFIKILKRGGLGYDCYLVYFIKHLGLRFNITFKKQE